MIKKFINIPEIEKKIPIDTGFTLCNYLPKYVGALVQFSGYTCSCQMMHSAKERTCA